MAASQRKYDLIALDLDGTVLNSRSEISRENRAAIARAREAGYHVTLCTGRGLKECRRYVDELRQSDPVVVAGGSIIADPSNNATLHRFGLEEELVRHAANALVRHGFPALVLKDPAVSPIDYLVVVGKENLQLDPVTTWWFQEMGVRARFVATMDEDDHPEHTVRFGACGMARDMAVIAKDLHSTFADTVHMHHFPAVVAPDTAKKTDEGEILHVLEVFSREGNKASALSWVAQRQGIAMERCVAMGDQINDVQMLSSVGLGIAMGNAVPQVKGLASQHTLHHDEHGVAHAIDMVLSGQW
jgi:hydroxymethylpyrimidine pyrophosphatase-like HAD family hydrolase